jgi:holo-[acyl-carrier protein] synthase
VRIGIDLASVEDVEDALRVHGDRYLRRVYTAAEVDDCRTGSGALDTRRLAARFAAKEAAFKALSPGDVAFPFTTVEVVTGQSGQPELALDQHGQSLAAAVGIRSLSVSLTHEGAYGAAVVIAEMLGDAA